ncbi:hypothetical protein llap_9963 [Limosa lapponica baueri]|uniref:Uncharacterized protein n=1 Tax=Limosa lapponica baueri TaxID=1758121 RepID=A0A2I0U142_LIMLA|nr:hypothetical protein llap_9963 [Limosa lapponica baueri]
MPAQLMNISAESTVELSDQETGIDWWVHSPPVGLVWCSVSCWVISSVNWFSDTISAGTAAPERPERFIRQAYHHECSLYTFIISDPASSQEDALFLQHLKKTSQLVHVSVVCAGAEAKGSEGIWLEPVALSPGEQVTADILIKDDMRSD